MIAYMAMLEGDNEARGGAEVVRAKLAFMEQKIYAGTEGVVADTILTKWLAEFDASKAKNVMTVTAKQAAGAANRAQRGDHRVGDGRGGDRALPPNSPGPPPDFDHKASLRDLTQQQPEWLDIETARSLKTGAWEFMQFDIQGVLYQCGALPFGWTNSPRIFVKLMKTLVGLIRSPQAGEDRHEVKKLMDGQEVQARELAGFNGLCQSVYLADPTARLYLHELYFVHGKKNSWESKVKLKKQAWGDLQWWAKLPATSRWNGRKILRSPMRAKLHTDSSLFAWVGVLNLKTEARGFWNDELQKLHITHLELEAVYKTVRSFLSELEGKVVRLYCDNQAVVAMLSHFASRNPELMRRMQKLLLLLDLHDIELQARYIRSEANEWADRLSRDKDLDDWRINKKWFKYAEEQWGEHSVDRFASEISALLPKYYSAWHDPGCEGVDSLAYTWRGEPNWVNPPWGLLDEGGLRASVEGATVIEYLDGNPEREEVFLEDRPRGPGDHDGFLSRRGGGRRVGVKTVDGWSREAEKGLLIMGWRRLPRGNAGAGAGGKTEGVSGEDVEGPHMSLRLELSGRSAGVSADLGSGAVAVGQSGGEEAVGVAGEGIQGVS
eukprot:gene34060-biopygen8622